MKKLLLLFPFALLLAACSSSSVEEANTIPEDLEGKRALLKEKRQALKSLQDDIETLEAAIQKQDPNAREKRTLVTTTNLNRKDFQHFVEVQGAIQSDDLLSASSDVGGRIIELRFEEGQPVSKGQLIAKLDLEQVKKQIAEVEKSKELAVEVFERQKRLWDQNIGSEIQYLQAKNNKERLEKSLETLQFQLEKSEVYAPISGVVDQVFVKAGEIAAPGAPILQILNTQKVKVVADVPENYLQNVRRGELVKVKIPALDKTMDARVTLIGRTINSANRTFKIEIDLPNGNGLLKPNLLANVLINDYTKEDAIVVPIELVQQEVGGRSYLFVTSDGEKGPIAKKVYVKPGESFEGEIIITEGLKGEEELIVQGARNISDTEPIEIQKG